MFWSFTAWKFVDIGTFFFSNNEQTILKIFNLKISRFILIIFSLKICWQYLLEHFFSQIMYGQFWRFSIWKFVDLFWLFIAWKFVDNIYWNIFFLNNEQIILKIFNLKICRFILIIYSLKICWQYSLEHIFSQIMNKQCF